MMGSPASPCYEDMRLPITFDLKRLLGSLIDGTKWCCVDKKTLNLKWPVAGGWWSSQEKNLFISKLDTKYTQTGNNQIPLYSSNSGQKGKGSNVLQVN